jgi:hypothetical protein
MKVLYVGLARTLWVFELPRLNPRGISLQPLIDGLRQRYGFSKAPQNPTDLGESKAFAFKAGTFVNSKGEPVMVALTIFNDGFVADTTSSTDDSTELLNDIKGWIDKETDFEMPKEVRIGYVSQIDFESDASLGAINPRMTEFLKIFSTGYKPLDNKQRVFEVASLGVWTEDVNQTAAPAIFRYERKIGPPFSAHHYFSQAPFETHIHIDAINRIEQLLKG